MRFHRIVAGLVLAGAMIPGICPALDKPTGAPLVMSDIETEQPIPLAYLSPEGKAACSNIRLHWSPSPSVSQDDTASFTLDIPADGPGAMTFTAQLWSASLAGSLAWQKPWQGAHWKIFETPVTDGTGIDAALAVGMIATSARRPYPKDTLVIGNLHPDSSLGAVSKLAERIDAAAQAGIKRVIIPRTEEVETDGPDGDVNIVRHADELGLKCIPVDNIVQATEVVMNDPLPDPPAVSGPPKYSDDVASYIAGFAQTEQTESQSGLQYAPREDQLAQYPPRQAAVWRQVYAEVRQGNEALKAGKVYVAWRLLARANSRMRGMNALAGDALTSFDVKTALATSDDLRQQLHDLMTPPPSDRAELQSGMLIAEMADWAYDIQALLEGSELVTKQTFSQRSDATESERDRARETILSANEEAKYLLGGAEFYTGLLPHLGEPNPLPANTNAATLLPQLIPAQLATAQIFTDGIRPLANEMRVGLLFDPRLAAYVNVLRDEQTAWAARERQRANNGALATTPTPRGWKWPASRRSDDEQRSHGGHSDERDQRRPGRFQSGQCLRASPHRGGKRTGVAGEAKRRGAVPDLGEYRLRDRRAGREIPAPGGHRRSLNACLARQGPHATRHAVAAGGRRGARGRGLRAGGGGQPGYFCDDPGAGRLPARSRRRCERAVRAAPVLAVRPVGKHVLAARAYTQGGGGRSFHRLARRQETGQGQEGGQGRHRGRQE